MGFTCLRLCDPQGLQLPICNPRTPWNPPLRTVGRTALCSLLQGIFPTQGSNPGLPHCRWILYHLSHQGSPRILEWVAYPFPSPADLPNPGIEPGSPALQAGSLPAEPRGKPKNTGVDSLSLLQQIFPTQESNVSPASQADSLPSQLSGKPKYTVDAPKVAIIIVI